MTESNMTKFIRDLGCDSKNNKNPKTRWVNTKKGWQNYKSGKIDLILKHINEKSIEAKSKWSFPKPVHDENRFEINHEVSEKLGEKGERNREVYVERYITKHNGNEMCNQWCVGANSKESIDLVYDNNGEYTLIELKVSGLKDEGTYTPPFALVEIIKNYFLAKKFYKEKNKKEIVVKELRILSTVDFYNKYKHDAESVEAFMDDIEDLNSRKCIPEVKLYYLDIDESVLVEKVKNDEFTEKIKFDKWKEIKDKNDWFAIKAGG